VKRHWRETRRSTEFARLCCVPNAVRPYRRDDAEALVSLWTLCGLTRPWNDPLRDIERKISVDPDGLLVLADGSQLIGAVMVGYDGHRGWINYLAVHPEHRRRGWGRALMIAAEERLSELGCPKVNLQVRASNQDAMAFYRAFGYGVDDVVSMGRRLENDA